MNTFTKNDLIKNAVVIIYNTYFGKIVSISFVLQLLWCVIQYNILMQMMVLCFYQHI